MWRSASFLLCLILQGYGVPLKEPRAGTCGYDACTITDSQALNVHIVAHSHDDVGWLKTIDQYYYGSENNIQPVGVQYIIDSVVRALRENPDRKFIQVETAFLWKWWNEQTQEKQQQFLELVENGQMEIVGGAWSMNDEAAVHYHSIIDQFTWGLKFLEDKLGECGRPKVGWQIDPFGHTREMASIFAQLGYDALLFARLDWRDKQERLKTQTAEILWRTSANFGDGSLLFIHALYNHYGPPPGFYFDVLSDDDPLVPNESSPMYNLKAKVANFTEYVSKQARNYSTNNVIVTMGHDFAYQDAHYNYKNLDILIKAFKDSVQTDYQGRRIKLFYSTPACYIKAVNEDATKKGLSFKVKTDDFIPHATDYNTYWNGYYTSRPTQKRFERQGNNLLQVAKQLTAFSREDSTLDKNLDELRSAMGIMQHHDAITGTERQLVAQDYARIVTKAFKKSHENINKVIPELLAKQGQNVNLEFDSCMLANVSHCEASQAKQFVVAIHNPLSRTISYHVRLPVNSNKFTVIGPNDEKVEIQITPSITDFSYVENIKPSKFDLVFLAKDLPPLGIKLYYVVNDGFDEDPVDIEPETEDPFTLGDEINGVGLNPNTGFSLYVTLDQIMVRLRQQLMYYIGAQGNNEEFKNRSSGAYIFRPTPEDPEAKPFTDDLLGNLKVYKGPLVDEAHQIFNDWSRQIVRVYKNGENHIEFDWLVGPLDISDGNSREVISRFDSTLQNDHFYTDSNGREILTRRNNFRATYPFSTEEPVSGNYYPVTSGISVRDEGRTIELAVLTDRAQGGACLKSGQIELMVHRRALRDDGFGLEEALNEIEFGQGLVVRGQHYLTLGLINPSETLESCRKKQREIVQRKLLSPWVFVADASSSENGLENLKQKLNFEFAGLKRSLPNDVQILTLEPWRNGEVLLRLENILEASEGGTEATVDLKELFTLFEVESLQETTLGANQLLNDNQRLVWNKGDCLPGLENECTSNKVPTLKTKSKKSQSKALEDLIITLKPMQIRTFRASVKRI